MLEGTTNNFTGHPSLTIRHYCNAIEGTNRMHDGVTKQNIHKKLYNENMVLHLAIRGAKPLGLLCMEN